MKKILVILLIFILFPTITYAGNSVLENQMNTLNISEFITKSNNYTKEAFPDMNLKNIFTDALTGKVDNKSLMRSLISIFGKELIPTLTIMGSILAIIILHGILKALSENIGNESTAQIAYFIEYIMIVALIMSNFSSIIFMVKDSISNLVGLMNSLVPILLALMMTTGNIVSAGLIQPLIIFMIVFIGNMITSVFLPITLMATSLGIISNLSDKIQIGKLANFFKSGIVWFLGIMILIFVSILSLEGTLTSNVDGLTAKGVKAVAGFIPVVGKALGDSVDMVLGSASLLKNSIGIVGVIMVIRYMCNSNN